MALVGEALLTASIQVLCDRIASRDFIDLFRRKKLDDSLLKKLDITLLGLSAVLNDCDRLRPSAEWGLQGLVSLQRLKIQGTDHLLETLLKEQLLPTTLNTLLISKQSLKSLNGKGLQHLTSLQSLQIDRCPNLERLPGEALQHLTSLQTLEIQDCPSLESLPGEGLPASLSFLRIYGCSSTLKKRYCENKTGEDWAKIARIPCIKIDEEVII